MTAGIYAISRISDKSRFYIGSAVCISGRWNSHRSRLRAGTHHSAALQRAWNKYGESDFEFSVLEEVPADDLIEREQGWIDRLAPPYNMAPIAGSSRGVRHTAEARKNMSIAAKGRKQTPVHVEKRSAANRGRPLSAEHRAKLSAAFRGRKRGPLPAEWVAKLAAANTGKVRTPEQRERMSEALKASWRRRKAAIAVGAACDARDKAWRAVAEADRQR